MCASSSLGKSLQLVTMLLNSKLRSRVATYRVQRLEHDPKTVKRDPDIVMPQTQVTSTKTFGMCELWVESRCHGCRHTRCLLKLSATSFHKRELLDTTPKLLASTSPIRNLRSSPSLYFLDLLLFRNIPPTRPLNMPRCNLVLFASWLLFLPWTS